MEHNDISHIYFLNVGILNYTLCSSFGYTLANIYTNEILVNQIHQPINE